jgi:Domain of unknown function (DUF4265)
MNSETTFTQVETIRVAAPVAELGIPICSEVMYALPDPADPDQAMLSNVPFLVDELNFGDIVRLGEEDESGVRPILEVVTASGHVHMLAATEPDEGFELVAELDRTFPSYALRITEANDHLVSVSVHPDLDPGAVASVIEAWLGANAQDREEGLAIGPACETELGPLPWSPMKGG